MPCSNENAGRIIDADGVVVWRVHDQQRLVKLGHLRHQIVFGDVVEEFAADIKRPARERDFHLAVLADVLDAILEQAGDMDGIGRRGDGDDGLGVRNLPGGGKNGSAAETMADQDRRTLSGFAQMVGGPHQIGDVRRECRVGEIAFAGAQARKVEPQYRDAFRRQRYRNPLGGQHVLAAGEAMREQRVSDRLPFGQIQRCRELMAAYTRELKTFSRHVGLHFFHLSLRER